MQIAGGNLLRHLLQEPFALFKAKSVTPSVYLVLPDEARMGGGRDAVVRAFHRAADLLVACRIDFSLLPDSLLDRLPKEAPAVDGRGFLVLLMEAGRPESPVFPPCRQ